MIIAVIAFFEEEKQRSANIASLTNAYGWAGLFNGFAGKDGGSKLEYSALLPFSEAMQEATESKPMSETTEDILWWLIKSNQLPPQVQIAALQLNKRLERLLED